MLKTLSKALPLQPVNTNQRKDNPTPRTYILAIGTRVTDPKEIPRQEPQD